MLGKLQYWIVKRWLLQSESIIVKKENGFTNIQVHHPKYGIVVLHPIEEVADIRKEKDFYPLIGYWKCRL